MEFLARAMLALSAARVTGSNSSLQRVDNMDFPLSDKESYSLLLLSGGVGLRSAHHEPKQFFELNGHPLIAHTLIAAMKCDAITEIVVNAPNGFEDRTAAILNAYCATKAHRIINPGESRQESCRLLVEAATNSNVIVHEAARPFITGETFTRLIADPAPNCGYFFPIAFSICKVSPVTQLVVHGVPREEVFNIMLPQKFERATLVAAHEKAVAMGKTFTEDAVMCVELLGTQFKALEGEARNLKITTSEDFVIAEQLGRRVSE